MLALNMRIKSDKSKEIIEILSEFGDKDKIRFPESAAIGIKPVSKEGSQRLDS